MNKTISVIVVAIVLTTILIISYKPEPPVEKKRIGVNKIEVGGRIK